MVSDAVAQEVQALHSILHIGSNPPRIAGVRVLWKRRGNGWHPQ